MQLSFLHNHPNDSFLSPIPCSAREEDLIISFLITSINNLSNPTFSIVLLVFQLLPTSKSLFPLSCVSLCHHVFNNIEDCQEQARCEDDRTQEGFFYISFCIQESCS